MDFVTDEFILARTGEVLEARLRGSEKFQQQVKALHRASKAFSKGSGMSKRCWKLYDILEDEWTKYNILYGDEAYRLGFEDGDCAEVRMRGEDELHNMDKALEQLAGHGLPAGHLSSWITCLM